MSGLGRHSGRTGPLPTCHTEMHRWAVENGYSSVSIAVRTGMSDITVRRHYAGWKMRRTTSRLYRICFPDMPGVPVEGGAQFYEHPLPLRKLPIHRRAEKW